MKQIMIAGAGLLAVAGASNASAMAADNAQQTKRIVVSGAKLDYTSTFDKSRRRLLAGTETDSGKRFDFRVSRDGYVSGTVDGKPVTFWLPRKDAATLAASRNAAVAASAGSR